MTLVKNTLVWAIFLGLAIFAGLYMVKKTTDIMAEQDTFQTSLNATRSSVADQPDEVLKIKVTAKNWSFSPSEIHVKASQKMLVTLESLDVEHGFAITELNVNQTIPAHGTSQVEFSAPETPGVYEFFCSIPCGAGHGAMRGKLIVK